MELHLKIVGAILMVLSMVHVRFPKYFNWAKELGGMSLINRQMMYVHTFFVALVVFLMGVLCLSSASLLVSTELGHRICLGLGVFWGLRLFFQFFVYSKELWKGKRFESVVHIVFSLLWIYFTVVFWSVGLLY
ncbi:hypothetical protein POV26_08850 [Aequorivita todarodis]|uniref:hypothetical protein n=1 Tax=Aequorivita todarodis TaxID=2036821 RepID=UPI002350D232|nr:hypothetical protein [Aequorivita todarodis]MDC8001144.1 hypothetical protein [Aequorivita todarodis]